MTFSWTRGNKNTRGQSTLTGDTSMLKIKNVRKTDAGRYRCTVRSGSLSVTSSAAVLTVNGAYCTLWAIATMLHCICYSIPHLANHTHTLCHLLLPTTIF